MQQAVFRTLAFSLVSMTYLSLSVANDFMHFEAQSDSKVKDEFGYYGGESVSKFHCAARCAWNESCMSVSYNQNDGACRLSEYRIIGSGNDNMVTTEQSWTSLSKKDGKPAYVYVGCYRNVYPRAMPLERDSVSMTIEMCAEVCAQIGTLYFGVEHYTECYCGNSNYDKYGPAPYCNYHCRGYNAQICGGFNAISVYSFT